MVRALLGACVAILGGCLPANFPMQGPALLPESFPPYGISFRRYEAPQFPYTQRALGVATGYSVVVVTVSEEGRVLDAVGIEASDPAFSAAVIEKTPQWLFAPTESATFPRREVLHYRFRLSGVVSSLNHREGAKEAFADSQDDFARVRTVAWNELDSPPVRLDVAAAEPRLRLGGSAEISFVIDQEGKVRVPVVTGATESDIGIIAIEEVAKWRYSPPRQDGRSVLVEVRARWGD
jgi:outer membrane biosynthesis protein TonB